MANTPPGFKPAPISGGEPKTLSAAATGSWVRQLAELVNNMLRGKINAVLQITLTAGAGSTIIKDARIGAYSVLLLEPLTAHAAAALYGSPYVLESSKSIGQVTLNHVNDANTDKTFNLLIIG